MSDIAASDQMFPLCGLQEENSSSFCFGLEGFATSLPTRSCCNSYETFSFAALARLILRLPLRSPNNQASICSQHHHREVTGATNKETSRRRSRSCR